jgi:hypothetical protein
LPYRSAPRLHQRKNLGERVHPLTRSQTSVQERSIGSMTLGVPVWQDVRTNHTDSQYRSSRHPTPSSR